MKKLVLSLCLLSFIACARKIIANGEPGSPYHSLLRKMTKEQKLFGIEKVFYKTSIAYKSCELRKAYVEEYAEVYKLKQDEIQKMLETEAADCEKYETFVVAHFATDRETRKLDKKPGVWKLTLAVDDRGNQTIAPESVTALSGEAPILHYFYPFLSSWSKNYVVKFPRTNPSKTLTIYMDGVEDHVKFLWDL